MSTNPGDLDLTLIQRMQTVESRMASIDTVQSAVESLRDDMREHRRATDEEMRLLRTEFGAFRRESADHHDDMMGILGSMLDDQRSHNQARTDRFLSCMGVVEKLIQRLTTPRVLAILSVAVLVAVTAGSGLGVTLMDWVTISPVEAADTE